MLPGKKYTPEDIVRIVLDRWWLILLPFVAGSALGVLAYRYLPPQFRSETLIMVVPQQIPDSYVQSTVTSRVEDRLPSIHEQILSRSNLERAIVEFDLYKAERTTGIMEDVVQRMRSLIEVRFEGKSTDIFRVSYVNRDRHLAQKVTERLASLYIEENLRNRENLAENTSAFIESQLQNAKARLIEQEQKLEEYRRRYAGQLPTQLSSNLQGMQNAQVQLQSIGDTVARARERRLLVERQLADAETLPISVVVPGAVAAREDPQQLPMAQQLQIARARLESLRRRYTEDHPDIRSQLRLIEDLEARVEQEAQLPPAVTDNDLSTPEAVRQKRIGDLKAQLAIIDNQIAAALQDEQRLKDTIAQYQARIDVLPTRESELVELTRDYGTLQEAYSSLLTKREESKLAANLERRQIGEQFRILDPASLPERPSNHTQRLTAMAGFSGLGLMLGLACVGFLEYRDSTFKTEEDVFRVLSVPVMALVPVMDGAAQPSGRHRKRFWGKVGTAVMLVAAATASIVWWGMQS